MKLLVKIGIVLFLFAAIACGGNKEIGECCLSDDECQTGICACLNCRPGVCVESEQGVICLPSCEEMKCPK